MEIASLQTYADLSDLLALRGAIVVSCDANDTIGLVLDMTTDLAL